MSGRAPSGQALAVPVEPASSLAPTGFDPSRDWQFTRGEVPPLRRDTLITALGRYGDIYGPLPFEMFAEDAWEGAMLGASHDLIAFKLEDRSWREIFPLVVGVDEVRKRAALATEARRAETGNTDSVHEGAGRRQRPGTSPSVASPSQEQM